MCFIVLSIRITPAIDRLMCEVAYIFSWGFTDRLLMCFLYKSGLYIIVDILKEHVFIGSAWVRTADRLFDDFLLFLGIQRSVLLGEAESSILFCYSRPTYCL